jgi:DNA invertase Pin-like site-specific DNA recombinase
MSTEVKLSTRDPAPEKIQARHCDRHAVVYVRQSTLRQVEQNRESTRLQYGLADRACRLGWRRDQVVVIDDDLGRSGAATSDRPGFQRLVAEVGLGHVGLVLGIEVSRLARSCRDWHQLLEMCALFDTLIGDADGIYDPGTYNDRLLLGLKGTMSEAELHILKSRMHEGRRAKAQRGELVLGLPRGYVLKPSGEIALDPDEGVRQVIGLVFAVFERRRSVSGLLRYLVDHDIQLPDRVRAGPDKGEVRWNRPNRATLSDMLRHPAYAGAYVYGRRHHDGRLRLPGKPHSGRRFLRDPQRWTVLHRGALPAYIDWGTFEQNQEQMGRKPHALQRHSSWRHGAAGRPRVLWRVRAAHVHDLHRERARGALCLPPDGRYLRGAALPVDQRPVCRCAHQRRDARGALALRHRSEPSGRRRSRTRTSAVAWAMEAAAGTGLV